MSWYKIQPSEHRHIIREYKSDNSIAQIAKKHGVCECTIRLILKKHNVKMRVFAVPTVPCCKHQDVIDKYLLGIDKDDIAKEYNTSKKAIENLLRRHKIKPIKQINIKNSPYRKKMAAYLRVWRKTCNMKITAKELGVTRFTIFYYLNKSKKFKEINYAIRYGGLVRENNRYALKMARKILATRLLGGKCTKCGNDNIFLLEFHHRDSSKKEYNMSNMFLQCKPWSVIKKELKKCKLLCRNCHVLLHQDLKKYERFRKLINLKIAMVV
jgi:predicted transcriptional regulator